MTELVRITGGYSVGLPVALADGSRFIVPAVVLINAAGVPLSVQGGTDLDTNGNVVPTYRAHAYTYDASGNLATDTVADSASTWVRTYTTGPTGTTADSGWVKQ